MRTASIIPLIGGMTLASEEVYGQPPDALISFEAFEANESHLRHYYEWQGKNVPYYVLDKDQKPSGRFDVVDSTCPCAGLSMFSTAWGAANPTNQWMIKSAKYVLGELGPRVYWGENSGNLLTSVGKPILDELESIGKENGYSMTLYKTKSALHGVPQVRERTFYFFWKGDRSYVLNYFSRPYTKIEDVITGVKSNFQMDPINPNRPTDDPYYRYLLEVVHGGITHREHFDVLDREADSVSVRYLDAKSLIEGHGHTYEMVGKWMAKNGYEKEVARCARMGGKLENGQNIMRRGTIVAKEIIGSFVGHYPKMLTHPYEDRYITYREAMSIMGLPEDFELLKPSRNCNHICQNVPVMTARDMAGEVLAALNGEREYVLNGPLYQNNTRREHETKRAVRNTLEGLTV